MLFGGSRIDLFIVPPIGLHAGAGSTRGPPVTDAVLRAIDRHVTPGIVAFDIGANRGLTAAALSSRGAIVYAFEPIPICAADIAARNLNQVTIIQSAVSDAVGEATFYVDLRPGIDMQASSLRELPDVENVPITVNVTTIDKFVGERGVYPDFIKIDVEGVEERVIAGGMKTIRLRKPIMIFEVWGYNWPRFETTIRELSPFYRFECASNGEDALARYFRQVVENDDVIAVPI
jgi:FkbM family methyltransferase